MKYVKIVFPLALITLLCISIFSCSQTDNPVVPHIDTTYHFDSASYVWTENLLLTDFSGQCYIPDTNNIYTLLGWNLRVYRNNNFENISLPYACSGIGGLDNNHIYLTATQGFPGMKINVIRILRYDGSTFTDLNFPTDTVPSEYSLNLVMPYSVNEVWFTSGYSPRIYKYDGVSFHFYGLDSGYIPTTDVIKTDNGLCIHAMRYRVQNNSIAPDSSRIYKFDGTKFNTVYSVKVDNTNISNYLMTELHNNLYSPRYDGLYKFNGNVFNKIISAPERFNIAIGGRSETDFIISLGNYGESYTFSNWNGIKWSKEFSIPTDGVNVRYVAKVENNYYVIYHNGLRFIIYTGRPKN